VTPSSQNAADAELLSEAIAALSELVSRAQKIHDRSFDDGHSVDTWQSDGLRAALERVEAVVVKAGVPKEWQANGSSHRRHRLCSRLPSARKNRRILSRSSLVPGRLPFVVSAHFPSLTIRSSRGGFNKVQFRSSP
jgi:hypothetical protein